MSKRFRTDQTSTPRFGQDPPRIEGRKRDSFLEDIGLASEDLNASFSVHHVDRHVTMRENKPPLIVPTLEEKKTVIVHQHGDSTEATLESNRPSTKLTFIKERPVKKRSNLIQSRDKGVGEKAAVKSKQKNNALQTPETKLKDVENRLQVDRLEVAKSKVTSNVNNEQQSHPSNAASKEKSSSNSAGKNKHIFNKADDHNRSIDNPSGGSLNNKEKPQTVALDNTVIDVVRQESTKVMRTMQELYFSAQINLIKNLMCQTDELIQEVRSSGTACPRTLMEENVRLRENVSILQTRNDELQKRIEKLKLVDQENIALKLKLKELST
ncbi:uncharacterized protein LOC105694196 [Orussus abietinus]|uniref:uncharacterized protein LOC105694196 n=1 Tax=Orussus abietinus TaxID=222816 RepID=UPI000626E05C|nr:uncharacterized protein LOC105694196 [Orussus abietinus]